MRRKYRFKIGDVVSSRREMRNGYAILPAGTLFTVRRRFGGYDLDSHPCDRCGVQLRMTRVDDRHVDAAGEKF